MLTTTEWSNFLYSFLEHQVRCCSPTPPAAAPRAQGHGQYAVDQAAGARRRTRRPARGPRPGPPHSHSAARGGARRPARVDRRRSTLPLGTRASGLPSGDDTCGNPSIIQSFSVAAHRDVWRRQRSQARQESVRERELGDFARDDIVKRSTNWGRIQYACTKVYNCV